MSLATFLLTFMVRGGHLVYYQSLLREIWFHSFGNLVTIYKDRNVIPWWLFLLLSAGGGDEPESTMAQSSDTHMLLYILYQQHYFRCERQGRIQIILCCPIILHCLQKCEFHALSYVGNPLSSNPRYTPECKLNIAIDICNAEQNTQLA